MYKNIIFDIGNVLLDFNPKQYLKTKISEEHKILDVYKAIFQSQEWAMLDRGTISEDEAIRSISKNSGENSPLIKLVFENWYDMLTPIEDSVTLLKELKNAQYKIYFLSNFHLLAFRYVTKKYDFFDLFDGGIVSYKEKLLKPEECIYKRLIEEYEINPQESIFIDDVRANVDAAKKFNFGTILLENPKDLREKLINLNIQL